MFLRSRVLSVALCLLAVASSPNIAKAAVATGSLRVTVVDSSDHAPVPLVAITVAGPVTRTGTTGASGKMALEGLPVGTYQLEAEVYGYTLPLSEMVSIAANREISMTLVVSKKLRTIAVLAAHRFPRGERNTLNSKSKGVRLAGNPVTAIGDLGGVTSISSAAGNQSFSMDGHPAGQGMLEIGGVPLAPPGAGFNLAVLNAGVFEGTSIDHSTANGSLGGTLNFFLPDPTIAWQGQLRKSEGGLSNSSAGAWVRGSAGYIGISVGVAQSGGASPIDGLRYLDQSGLLYEHRALTNVDGMFLKVRAPSSDANVVRAFLYSSSSIQSDFCNTFTALVPCGFGPGNALTGRIQAIQLGDVLQTGIATLSLDGNASGVDQNYAFDDRLFGLAPIGFSVAASTNSKGVDASLKFNFKNHRSLTIAGQNRSYILNTAFPGSVESISPASNAVTLSELSAHYQVPMSRRTTVTGGLVATAYRGLSPQFSVDGSAVMSLGRSDQLEADGVLAAPAYPSQAVSGLDAPQSLQFDCRDQLAFGAGPAQGGATVSRANRLRVDWHHYASRWSSSLALFRSDEFGSLLTTTEAASSLGASSFPPGYLSQVNQIYASPNGCNGQPIGLSSLILAVPVLAGHVAYTGVTAKASLAVGPKFTIVPQISLVRSSLVSNEAAFENGNSIVIPGRQLPRVPQFTAGLLVDARISSSIEGLLRGQYVGSNNGLGLPPTAVWSFATIKSLRVGAIALRVSNLFNTHASTFSTFGAGVALATVGGSVLPQIGESLLPRSLSLDYRVAVGAPSRRPLFSKDNGNDDVATSSFTLLPFPQTPPLDALNVNRTAASCGPEYVAKARAIYHLIQRAAANASMGVLSPVIDKGIGVKLYPRIYRGHVFVAIGVEKVSAANATLNCGYIHGAHATAYAPRGLYVPSGKRANQVVAIYARSVGLYIANTQWDDQVVRVEAPELPAVAPRDPFALSPSCRASNFGGAKVLMEQLRQFAGAHFRGPNPAWRAIARRGAGGDWYELWPKDPALQLVVDQCAVIAEGARSKIRALGFDVGRQAFVNFTQRLGLYRRAKSP